MARPRPPPHVRNRQRRGTQMTDLSMPCGVTADLRRQHPNLVNMIGKKIHKLTVIGRAPNNKKRRARWECVCDCGGKIIAVGGDLRSGKTKSCGCMHRAVLA